ncbi:MAG TPA: redox-sensing transcriptional repressor Rex [Syntrophorhabdaceae bacterium]|nr:redox-sensing transcriptional repressor Rex [Syntrophorhabdaceae bacterium]HPP07270.1 redox-sensing transcriptional repressor Rex [Syntrophorhabdaceae bacterium]
MNKDSNNLKAIKPIPEPTLRRLPIYYQYLKKLHNEKKLEFISATQMGSDLNITPIQIKKDIEVTEVTGKPKLGYSVSELIKRIEDFLGWNNVTDAFLVGVGNLGSALLGYNGFKEYGLNIIAGFDDDENKVGREIGGKMVFHVNKLPGMVKRMGIKIGILTVPAIYAQEVTDMMIKAGIRAIWNFTHIKLNVPQNIIVQHENLAASLVVLSKKLEIMLKSDE